MKRLLCSVLLIAFLSVTATGQFPQITIITRSFILKGRVIGQNSGYVHLAYTNCLGKYILDSCLLRNGKFKLKGLINEPTCADFYGNRKSRSVDDPDFTELYIGPGVIQAVFQTGDFKHARIEGSKTQREYAVYTKRNDSLNRKWQRMWSAMKNARAKNDTLQLNYIYNYQMPVYRTKYDQMNFAYIRQFPGSAVSANLLISSLQKLTLDSLKMFYHLLSRNNRGSKYGQAIKGFIENAEQLVIGKEAPGFTRTDKNGKRVSLKDFRGKYVLLEFWASWCEPCRAEHPYLKQAYAKYQNKGFDIISISLNNPAEKKDWLDAIDTDQLDWTQLCDFKSWGSDLITKFNLFGRGIPSNFLIGPNGQIIARDLRGDALEKKLREFNLSVK